MKFILNKPMSVVCFKYTPMFFFKMKQAFFYLIIIAFLHNMPFSRLNAIIDFFICTKNLRFQHIHIFVKLEFL